MSTNSVLTKKQVKTFRTEYTNEDGQPCVLIAEVRYDDECNNGHNTFAITGELYDRSDRIPYGASVKNSSGKTLWLGSCGCLHEEIAKRFPELAPFIKWHLVNTDGPMHYIANSTYHAKAIPKEQGQYYAYFKEPVTGVEKLLEIVDEATKAKLDALHGDAMRYEPYYNRMAKESNLEAARSSAVWPDAQLEDFTEEKLKARLPALMEDFKRDVESLGFTY